MYLQRSNSSEADKAADVENEGTSGLTARISTTSVSGAATDPADAAALEAERIKCVLRASNIICTTLQLSGCKSPRLLPFTECPSALPNNPMV